jgi:hypothetical protein
MKYATYTELAEAFRSGELSKDDWILVLDNDSCHLDWRGACPPGVSEDEYRDKKYEEGRGLFQGNGYQDLEDAVTAAGIPCEWC